MIARQVPVFGCRIALVLAACALAVAAPPSFAVSMPLSRSAQQLAHRAAQSSDYLKLAEAGIAQSASWRSGGWYCEYLGCTGAYPLLTIWGDVRMFESVDAMELAFSREHLDTFVIVSGDSDFTPLVGKLRELNKRVTGL